MKVFVIVQGDYETRHVKAVCATEKCASERLARLRAELDDPANPYGWNIEPWFVET